MKFFQSSAQNFFLYLAVGFLLYSPVFNAPFIFDDHDLIVGNPLVRHLPTLWSEWRFAGLKFLTYFTFALNYLIGGENPFTYHIVNILLHSINAWLVFILTRIVLTTPVIASQFPAKQKNIIPTATALLFLVHPVATSAVSYIWQRAELLSALFYLSSLIFYLRGRTEERKSHYFVWALFCFFAGLFAKGTIISLPWVVILLECALWPVSRRKIYTIIISLTALYFLKSYAMLWSLTEEIYTQRIVNPLMQLTGMLLTPGFLWTQLFVTVRYLGLAVFPFSQNFDYDIPLASGFWELRIFSSAVFLLVLIVISLKIWNTRRLLSVGIFWFLLCLVPASLMGGREPMWEYRMYFSLAGLIIGVVATIFQTFKLQRAGWLILSLFIVFSSLAFSRNMLWRSPESLLLDNITKSPHKANPYHLLGTFYLFEGRIDEAQFYLEKTIALAPDAAESYNNLGLIAKNHGEVEKAERYFRTAIRFRSDLTGAYVNLSLLLLGKGQDKAAEKFLRQSLSMRETEGAYAALGKVYLSRGRLSEAEGFLKKALEVNPAASQAYYWYGELFALRAEPQKAREMFRKAVMFDSRLKEKVPSDFR